MKFNTNGTKIIRDFYEECKVKSQNNINPLNQEIDFEKSYMTDLLQGLIDNSYKLNPIFVNGGWIELDSINDYNLYKKLFEQNELNHLINLSE